MESNGRELLEQPGRPVRKATGHSAAWPRISLVTPSFNQAPFLEKTIESVLSQGYPNLEYIIIDGGSTDGSVDIIKRYENQIDFWISEPDRGQYHGIDKGFSRSSGEILAWLNSDDMYLPWTLKTIGEVFGSMTGIDWVTSSFPMSCSEAGDPVFCRSMGSGFSRQGFYRGENFSGGDWFHTGYIQQESTFWRRTLWEKAGSRMDERYKLAADFELWARFFQHGELYGIDLPLALFRDQPGQKSAVNRHEYIHECHQILARYGGRVPGKYERRLMAKFPRMYSAVKSFFSGQARRKNARIRYHAERGWLISG